jgi:hypothetical protein
MFAASEVTGRRTKADEDVLSVGGCTKSNPVS